jgi:hypothetical protein
MTSLRVRGALVLVTTAALASPVTSAVASAQAAEPVAAAGASAAPVTAAEADALVRKLVRTTNQGKKSAARKVASKEVVTKMFRARKDGFRFDKPFDDCLYDADQQGFNCSTAIVMQGVLQGSAFFFVPAETSSPAVTKVSLSFGE